MKRISTLLGIFAAFLIQFVSSNAQAASIIKDGDRSFSSHTVHHGLPNAVIFHKDDSSDDDISDDDSSDDDSSDDEAPAPPLPPPGGGGLGTGI